MKLNAVQYDFLLGQLNPNRVRQLRGNSHLEAWDVRRHLIRVFGFGGFDIETKSLDLVAQIEHTVDKEGKKLPFPRWTVVYRAEIRLVVKNPDGTVLQVFEDGAAGDAQNQPSLGDAHDQAMKTALSQGLKRCAVNLGDQFGLSLYNGGQVGQVVHRTAVPTSVDVETSPTLPSNDAPVLPEPQREDWQPPADPDAEWNAAKPASAGQARVFEWFVAELAKAPSKEAVTELAKSVHLACSSNQISKAQLDLLLSHNAAARLAELEAS